MKKIGNAMIRTRATGCLDLQVRTQPYSYAAKNQNESTSSDSISYLQTLPTSSQSMRVP